MRINLLINRSPNIILFIRYVVLPLLLSLPPQVNFISFSYYPYYDPLLRSTAVDAEITASRLRRSRLEADIAT